MSLCSVAPLPQDAARAALTAPGGGVLRFCVPLAGRARRRRLFLPATPQRRGEAPMNLHEYQARDLLRGFGLPVPEHMVVSCAEEAAAAARRFGSPVVLKAQVHAGGRG